MKKFCSIVFANNLPFILWSVFVILSIIIGKSHDINPSLDTSGFTPKGSTLSACPVKLLLGWCPACGLTRDYLFLLQNRRIINGWFGFIFTLFLGNFIWSLYRAIRGILPRASPK